MKKIKVSVIGSQGRMGQEVLQVLSESKKSSLSVEINRSQKLKHEHAKKTDVLIDFSSVENIKFVSEFCSQHQIPLICGVTGLQESHFQLFKKAAQKTAIFWSPNMSLGVAALTEALKTFSNLSGFDFQIEEFHHNKKKDNPSGTALALQKELKQQVKQNIPEPIGIRGGGIFGIHRIHAMSESETLCFEHVALRRKVFAEGAVRAAEWLVKQKKGYYQMSDLLKGLRNE